MEFIRKFDCELTGTEVHIYRTQEGEEIAYAPALGELEVNEDEEEIEAICIEYLIK
jgi:hypothetical protein